MKKSINEILESYYRAELMREIEEIDFEAIVRKQVENTNGTLEGKIYWAVSEMRELCIKAASGVEPF